MMMEGVRLMAVGMFTVFGFLILLVGLMKASAAFFEANAHRFPEPAAPRPEPAASRRGAGAGASPTARAHEAEIALAIAVAGARRAGRRI